MKISDFQYFVDSPKPVQSFIPEGKKIGTFQEVKPYFDKLLSRTIQNKDDLFQWLKDRSELNSWLEEDMAWRYIRMTCDTSDKAAVEAYQFFVEQIEPEVAVLQNQLDQKLVSSPGFADLDFAGASILIRDVEKELRIFREENIPLQTAIQTKAQEFSSISGSMSIQYKDQELTMPVAGALLQSIDREERKEVYEKIQQRRWEDGNTLQTLFSDLVQLRHQVAQNAGFANFRDYMFIAMGRFDYQPADCLRFHEAVEATVVPLVGRNLRKRKEIMKLDSLRPYDLAVEVNGKAPLKAFDGGNDLLAKGKEVFRRLHPVLGNCLSEMEKLGHFDLESRKGKAPGGYNYPLDQSGFPFIFMNASSTLRDLVTLMHEGGHAVHSIVTRFLPLSFFKHTPSEVAELASMSMELMSMDHWDVYFPNPDDLKRAKKEHLEQVIDTLPWVATIDAFQHWIYENPNHSVEERSSAWIQILDRFSTGLVDFEGYQHFRLIGWQKQLHLFEVPFYYIEYGMAQLGAIAVWRNYRKNPEQALTQYLNALALGHTAGLREVYETAGIKFDFSESYIRELMEFVSLELEAL